jgi:hypothetical protein
MSAFSAYASLNKLRASWKNRFEVNSTISGLNQKIIILQKSRAKEMKKCSTEEQRNTVRKRYDNEIKYNDYLLYLIKLKYYDIVGTL